MGRIPHETKDRKKMSNVWIKGVWVGRTENSDEHLLLTPRGVMRTKMVRRLPPAEVTANAFYDTVKGQPWDEFIGSHKLLRGPEPRVTFQMVPEMIDPRPADASPMGETETAPASASAPPTETVRTETPGGGPVRKRLRRVSDSPPAMRDDEVMIDGAGASASSSSSSGGGIVRARTDAGTDDQTKRPRVETMMMMVMEDGPADDAQDDGQYADIVLRSPESIVESRQVEIDKWMERGVVERWPRSDVESQGYEVVSARWVDDPYKEKSRYVIREFAKKRDATVFAAASDPSLSRLVELKALQNDYPTFSFDVTSAYTHAEEKEMFFFEPPPEDAEKHPGMVWRALRVIYGRRKGARTWQEHFHEVVTSDEAKTNGFTVTRFEQQPTLYYLHEADGVMELHVDDGHGTGRPAVTRRFLEWLQTKIELKWVDELKFPQSYEYLKSTRVRTHEGLLTIPNARYLERALDKYGMLRCNGSNSPKLDKKTTESDLELLNGEDSEIFRSATLTLLYLANERTDITSTVRHLCTRLKTPTVGDERQLKKLLRYVQQTKYVGMQFTKPNKDDNVLKVYTDSDWASDVHTRKSTSGAVIMFGNCRLHAHARGQKVVALSSCEAELYAACEGLKEALLIRSAMIFLRMGEHRIELYTDSSSARQFCHKRGVGRMKHLDIRALWLQDAINSNLAVVRKIPRSENIADLLTHPPSALELEEFGPMIGLRKLTDDEYRKMTNKQSSHYKAPTKRTMAGAMTTHGLVGAILVTTAAAADMVAVPQLTAATANVYQPVWPVEAWTVMMTTMVMACWVMISLIMTFLAYSNGIEKREEGCVWTDPGAHC